MNDFTPSPHQQAFLEWLKTGKGSAIVKAVAGSGKTTTVMQGVKILPDRAHTKILMFNTNIAKEATARLNEIREKAGIALPNCSVSTFHSLGFSPLKKWISARLPNAKIEPDGNKLRKIMQNRFSDCDQELYGHFCMKLTDFAMSQGIGAITPDLDQRWYDLIAHHDIYLDDEDANEAEAIRISRDLLRMNNEAIESGMVSFSDMLYQPLRLKLRLWQHDYIFIDEAQDTNPVRRALAKAALRPGGRLIAVGDPKQAIYGFTGASHDAMDLIASEFNTTELPLTVCYRCAKSIVASAQAIVDYIEPHQGAEEGQVSRLHSKDVDALLTKDDAVLCRNVAPLITYAFASIAKGIPVTLLGREIGKGLISLVKKQKARGIDQLIQKLEDWCDREHSKFMAKGEEQKAENVADRVACIFVIIDNLPETERTVPALIARLDTMFDEATGKLTLSTVHKAKGREWPTVAILRPDLMPSKWARQEWQAAQERNLQYVAITRARNHLIYIDDAVLPMKKGV